MSRIKLILLSLGAVFAVGAAVSSSASAATANLYYEQPSKAIAETRGLIGTVGKAQFQSELSGTKILIECTTNTFTGEIGPGGKSAGKIEYKGCSLFSIKEGVKTNLGPNCKVTEPITFSFKDKLFYQTKAGVVADEFEPATGSIFVELKIGGVACLFTGSGTITLKVEGTYTASLGDQAEEDNTEHELVFNEAGANVVFETKTPAAYTNTVTLRQANNKGWYVD